MRKTNQELNALRHEKIQFTYDKQHLEGTPNFFHPELNISIIWLYKTINVSYNTKLERYKILDNHFNIKNDENRSNKELLRQVQKINEQLEKQARQVDIYYILL